MLWGYTHSSERLNVYNLATDGATSVRDIADIVTHCSGLSNVEYRFTGGSRGWIGDVPQVRIDCKKMESIGWKARYSSYQAVENAVKDIMENRR